MNPGKLIIAGMAAGAITLMAATPALASGIPLDIVIGDVTVAPEEGRGGKRVTVQTRKWYVEYRDPSGTKHSVAGYTEVDAVREIVRQVIEANRDLTIATKDDPADGNDDGCTYQYAGRKGLDAPQNWTAFVTASWRV